MPTEVVNGLIGGAGIAGVWLLCIMLGWMYPKPHVEDLRRENKDLKDALALSNQRADNERRRADSAEVAAQTANILLAGIRKGIDSGN